MSRFCLGMGMARGEGVAMEVGQEAAWPLAERSLRSVARPRLRAACLRASRSRTRGLAGHACAAAAAWWSAVVGKGKE